MVSMFQKLAPTGNGSYVSVKELRQYAGVVMDYTSIQRNASGYQGKPVHKVFATFTCFNSDGEIVHTTLPGTTLDIDIKETKTGEKFTIIDRLPNSDSGVVLVRFYLEKDKYNAMGEIQDATLVENIEKSYAAAQAPAPAPAVSEGPPPF